MLCLYLNKKNKTKKTGETVDNGTKDVKIIVPLKYLGNFWRAPQMTLISCEINLIITWSCLRIVLYLMLLRMKQQYLQ